MASNFERMMQLVGEFFDTKNDPDQLDVNEQDRERLELLHPATMNEYADENGPIVWILMIPTSEILMHQFLRGELSETALLHETPLNEHYEAIYLCSATVLPEHRRQGLALRTAMDGINSIRKDHPIKYLFTWSFSTEGKTLANSIAAACNLPLYEKVSK